MTKKSKESKTESSIKMDIEAEAALLNELVVEEKPKKAEKAKAPLKVPIIPEIKRVEAIIPYRVFEKISGRKWDQMAGFKNYVKRETLGPRTVKKWHEALQAFLNMPV